MASFKRVNSDYSIITDGEFTIKPNGATIESNGDVTIRTDANDSSEPQNNVVITTNTVRVEGNLDVVGDVTYINASELNITDPFIQLNSADSGVGFFANAGVLTHIDSTTFAGIRYNSNSGQWEISNNTGTTGETGTWEVLATASSTAIAAGSDREIQFNQGGVFGASSSLTFNYNTNQLDLLGNFLVSDSVAIGSHAVLANTSVLPNGVADSAVVYHNAVSGGGTGVYVKTDTVEDELVSRTKAIVFGIIF